MAPLSLAPGPSRIINGTEVAPHSIPWQASLVALFHNNGTDRWHWGCGGTILSKRYVLSAGHCIGVECAVTCKETNCKNYTDCDMETCCIPSISTCIPLCDTGRLDHVSVKEHNQTDDSDGQNRIEIGDWQNHPEYNASSQNHSYDFALIYLKEPIILDAMAVPACLPTSPQIQEDNFLVGKTLTVSGWGVFNYSYSLSDVLFKIDVIGESNAKCKKMIDHPEILFPPMLCGIPLSHQTPCMGDSGGPLTYMDENGVNSLVGVVSMGGNGPGPCPQGGVGIYSRVTSALDWITKTMANAAGKFTHKPKMLD